MALRILMFNWRDMHHPEAGGAEKYLVTVAEGLAARGHEVIFRTSGYPGALEDEVVGGVRYVRKGGRYGIYPRALAANLTRRYNADVVIDVQNGVPYLSPLTRRGPVINLVHHVHKEQWPIVFGPRLSRAGWWLESRLAPRVYRRTDYIAVSDSTRQSSLASASMRIESGSSTTGRTRRRWTAPLAPRTPRSSFWVASFRRSASSSRSRPWPGSFTRSRTSPSTSSGRAGGSLSSSARAEELGVEKYVTFHGHVSEAEKHHLLARAWVHALPSLKEGWGLVVVEAGVHGTPDRRLHRGRRADELDRGRQRPGSLSTTGPRSSPQPFGHSSWTTTCVDA